MSTAPVVHGPDGYWGVCPECHKNDGCINIGRGHWYYCKEHKKCWYVGSNLFSGWKDQTEDEQRAIHDSLGFAEFEHLTIAQTHCDECGTLAGAA